MEFVVFLVKTQTHPGPVCEISTRDPVCEIRSRTSCGEKPSEGACSEREHHNGHAKSVAWTNRVIFPGFIM